MKIGINGFGRIGRTFYRAGSDKLSIAAINDLGDTDNLKYLLKYDTVYGEFNKTCDAKFVAEKDAQNIPWKDLGVEVVVESTGFYTKKEQAESHIKAGAKRVVISAPSDDADITIIPGVNEDKFDSEKHRIISMGSCTTNCIVPVAYVLNKEFGIIKGSFVTVHSYTATQALVDRPDQKDYRRGRGGAENIVPTTTGAAKAIFQVLPELTGKIDALSVRIPTSTVSMIDFTCLVDKKVTAEEVNEVLRNNAKNMKGALTVCDEPLVSTDFKGNPNASIVDSALTTVTQDNLIHVVAWYDNEMGYSNRLVELCKFLENK